jgi:segregation and condensation protein A
MDTAYRIKTAVFEGPLDLLLDLIEKRKLFINDVSLAAVTDDYIEYVNREGVLELPEAAHFVYIASTLLLIKSKSLLPTLSLTEEEAGDIQDLERRLTLYKRFKELSTDLRRSFGRSPAYFKREVADVSVFSPGETLTPGALLKAVRRVCAEFPPLRELTRAVVEKVMSLEEMIDALAARITKSLRMSFKEFSGEGSEKSAERGAKLNVIVSFLALLELVKRGAARVEQSAAFDDIVIEADTVEMPRYT